MLKNTAMSFHGRKASIAFLARHIGIATRCFSDVEDRNLILNERNPENLGHIMNDLFRPEVRVPCMAGIKYIGYLKYNFGNR